MKKILQITKITILNIFGAVLQALVQLQALQFEIFDDILMKIYPLTLIFFHPLRNLWSTFITVKRLKKK